MIKCINILSSSSIFNKISTMYVIFIKYFFIIEKIKSKRLAEYECDKSSREQKELDDLLVQGHSREMNLNYA